MSVLSRSAIHVGAVRGRYFRENFAQGGIDLSQIVPELVTNADAAIAASGRERGRIEIAFAAPEPEFFERWRAQMRALRMPALRSWRLRSAASMMVSGCTPPRSTGAWAHWESCPSTKVSSVACSAAACETCG